MTTGKTMAFNRIALLIVLALTSCASQRAAISAGELRNHVSWLAADEQEGREAGTDAAARSAVYLRRHLDAAGLIPAGDNGTYFQYFDIAAPSLEGASTLMIGNDVFDVNTLSASPAQTHHAQLVFADADDVEDMIVLAKSDGEIRAEVREAAANGAVAIVLASDEFVAFDAVPGKLPIAVVLIDIKLYEKLTLDVFNGKVNVRLKADVQKQTKRARNVLALSPGISGEVITVGAHFDHLGWGGEGSLAPGTYAVHNGADDNASGTAVLLELAEMWGANRGGPVVANRGVLFCFWSAEEKGLLGSDYWVENPTIPLPRVLANVNLDMVGRVAESKITVGSASTGDCFGEPLAVMQAYYAANEIDFKLNIMKGSLPGGGGSDHMSFHKKSIPAIFFFSGLHSDYHKPSDDAHKLAYPQMAVLADGLAEFIASLQVVADGFEYHKPQAPVDEEGEVRHVKRANVWFGSIPDYGAEPLDGGMQLSGTSPGSPAEKAGLLGGDILKQVADVEIFDIYDFMDSLSTFNNGDTIGVKFLRDGEMKTTQLTFFPRPVGSAGRPH
ncbi:MAG TPA: M28 family peptidase [Planctomycetes bacterium]|nr:M28 family peptidase [Planctomycetota bacterium]